MLALAALDFIHQLSVEEFLEFNELLNLFVFFRVWIFDFEIAFCFKGIILNKLLNANISPDLRLSSLWLRFLLAQLMLPLLHF